MKTIWRFYRPHHLQNENRQNPNWTVPLPVNGPSSNLEFSTQLTNCCSGCDEKSSVCCGFAYPLLWETLYALHWVYAKEEKVCIHYSTSGDSLDLRLRSS